MIRMLADNALIALEPLPKETASGIALPDRKAKTNEHRFARVLSVGPGHSPGCKVCSGVKSVFIPTTLRVGDRIIVGALSGNRWDLDVSSVRQNERADFDALLGERGEYRVIREAECLAVIDEEAKAAE